MVVTGLDRLISDKNQEFKELKNKNIGIITNHTSVTTDLKLGVEELLKKGFKIKKIFGAEHGFRGNYRAGATVTNDFDERTSLPVYSLYGTSKKPTKEMLQGLDALVFDMQDIGVRFYTYIYTMAYTMEAAAALDIEYYVLDRPNPLTGIKVEGNILDLNYRSFVGNYPIALRHGMTIGELALLFNDEFNIGCSLKVIKMKNWERSNWFEDTKLPWVMPSPNSTGMEMAILYPGTCLFEGTNVSEGRGTTRPFEIIGAPWIDGNEWADYLNKLSLQGVIFRPTYFTPLTSKHQGEQCQGVQVHVINRQMVEPFRVGCFMIESLKKIYPNNFDWLKPSTNGKYFIDLLTGTNQFRLTIAKEASIDKWLNQQSEELNQFIKVREKYLLY